MNLGYKSKSKSTNSFPNVIVIDIGGTFFRISVLKKNQRLIDKPLMIRTPNFINHKDLSIRSLRHKLIQLIIENVNKFAHDYSNLKLKHIGISFAGPVSSDGTVLKSPPIFGKYGKPFTLKKDLQKKLPQFRISVENDISAATYRYALEYKLNHNGINLLSVITVSSGIGNKIIDLRSNSLHMDQNGYSGELGHLKIDFSSKALTCDCGEKGHLMAYASGRAAEKRVRKYMRQNPNQYKKSLLFELSKGRPSHISNKEFVESIKRKDPLSLNLLDILTQPLANSIITQSSVSGVEKFYIIGGFALAVGKPYIESIRRNMLKIGMFGVNEKYLKSLVELGKNDDHSGLIGIGLMVQNGLKN